MSEKAHAPLQGFPGIRHRETSRFNTARRAFAMLDMIGRREGLTAKYMARELGIGLSTCYCLLNVLLDEGYIERREHRKGYRLGPTVSRLYALAHNTDVEGLVQPVVRELAHRSARHAYLGMLVGDDVTVARVESPRSKPPIDLVSASHAASHALAVGKVLVASTGPVGVDDYARRCGLEAFTSRTITDVVELKTHLAEVGRRGFASDVEEFLANLCCVAAPIVGASGRVEGAIGVSTDARHFYRSSEALIELVTSCAREASCLLGQPPDDVGHRT